MASNTFLAGDLGGTKTLLSIYGQSEEGLQPLFSQRFTSGEWPSLEAMLKRFLAEVPSALPKPQTSCIAVAGPVHDGGAKLTNLPWELSEHSLCEATGLARLGLVNDFAVLIHGLPHFSAKQQVLLQAGRSNSSEDAPSQGPVAILGAGTGLGMARGLPAQRGWLAVASEGGHR